MISRKVNVTTHLKFYGLILCTVTLLAVSFPQTAQAATSYTAEFWKFAPGTAAPSFPASTPTHQRPYDTLNINWGSGGPHNDVGTENFLARFTKSEVFERGVYRFTVRADDGVRVYADGQLVINRWFDQAAPTVSTDRFLAAGNHTIKVEYYERTDAARIQFDVEPVATAGRGMWVWDRNHAIDPQKRSALLQFAQSRNIDRIYMQSQYLLQNNPTALTSLITEASARGIEVELLFGDPAWTTNHVEALQALAAAKAYAKSAVVKPAGIHFDVEPQGLPSWRSNTTYLSNQYVDLLEKLRLNKGDLRLSADFAMGYEEILLTRGGVTKELTKWVLDQVDRGYLMDYRDFAVGTDGIIDNATMPVQYGANLGKPVGIAVETKYFPPNDLENPSYITFHDEGNAYMEQELAKVITQFRTSGGFAGLSIHDYDSYTALKP